jgi:ankyrin repeat protein
MGGEPERQLVAATKAADIGKVNQFLASGANPNKMISFEGHRQSAWYQALWQLRPRRPELVEIVRVMLKAGASTKSAWGTSSSRPQESIWRSFLRPGRVGGSGEENPLHVAMMHPVPAVVRALIDAGLDPRQGESELASAVETGEVEIVHMLVEAGVDVNNHRGANTPLLAAIEARNVALMTYLEEHGAREKP